MSVIIYWTIAILVVVVIASLRALKLNPSNISQFELSRRAESQDLEAIALQRRDARLPDIRALRYVADTVLSVGLSVYAVAFLGLWLGGLAVLVGLLFASILSRLPLLNRLSQSVYRKLEPKLMELVSRIWWLLKAFRPSQDSDETVQLHSKEELINLAKQSKGLLSHEELLLVSHGLQFSSKTVRVAMKTKSAIKYVADNEVLGPVTLDTLHKTGHAHFPVIKKDLDHVVGILHMSDLLPLTHDEAIAKTKMRTPVHYIDIDDSLEKALRAFLRTHSSLFIVVSDHKTVGLLSLDDVLGELIGRKIEGDKEYS